MWSTGIIKTENGAYEYQVKHFSEGSEYGINGGKISKLWIGHDGKTVCNYDRGWDITLAGPADKAVYDRLIGKYN